MIGLGKYAIGSTLATIGVVYHAYYTRKQFYPAMLYLATSKASVFVLGNMAFVLTISFGQLVKMIFLGNLREAEVERLYELSRHEIMETCLAMTIFREEFNTSFVAMFTALLFIKIFHWLSQKRVEYIETTPVVSRLSHARIITFMGLLLLVDYLFLQYAVSYTWKNKRPSVLLLFAFEYVILASSIVATLLKYALYAVDMVMEGQWDNKAVYVFYLELVRDLLHLFVYLIFFLIIFIYYGLPLHLVRDLYETFRNFKARVADFIRYRRITSNLNDRFLDASPEELSRGDATCIICREEMTTAKKLPCGHLFHVHCLRSWLERQQTCPTCRSSLLGPDPAQEGAAADNNQLHPQPPRPDNAAAGGLNVGNHEHPPIGMHMHHLMVPLGGGRPAAGEEADQMHRHWIAYQEQLQRQMGGPYGVPQLGWTHLGATWFPANYMQFYAHQLPELQRQQQGLLFQQLQQMHQQRITQQLVQFPFLMPGAIPPPFAAPEGQPQNGPGLGLQSSSSPGVAANGTISEAGESEPQDAGLAQSGVERGSPTHASAVPTANLAPQAARQQAELQAQAAAAAAAAPTLAQLQAYVAQLHAIMGAWPLYGQVPLYGPYPPIGAAPFMPTEALAPRTGGVGQSVTDVAGQGQGLHPSQTAIAPSGTTQEVSGPGNISERAAPTSFQAGHGTSPAAPVNNSGGSSEPAVEASRSTSPITGGATGIYEASGATAQLAGEAQTDEVELRRRRQRQRYDVERESEIRPAADS